MVVSEKKEEGLEEGPSESRLAVIDFTAQEDFWSDETQSQYVKDLSYTVAEDRGDLVDEWVKQGKVALGRPEAQVTGGDN